MFKILNSLKKFDIIGFDVVEVNPMVDASGITAMMAQRLSEKVFCLLRNKFC